MGMTKRCFVSPGRLHTEDAAELPRGEDVQKGTNGQFEAGYTMLCSLALFGTVWLIILSLYTIQNYFKYKFSKLNSQQENCFNGFSL